MTKITLKNKFTGKRVWFSIWVSCLLSTSLLVQGQSPAQRYEQMQRGLSSGWNTWDTRSVLTHVLLPYGAAIDLNLTNAAGQRVNNFRIGDRNPEAPVMHPGPHTYDGFYTDISLNWKGQKLRVQSASEGRNNLIFITPLADNEANGKLIITPKALWYRENKIEIKDKAFTLEPFGEDWKIDVQINGNVLETNKQEIIVSTAQPIVIACGMNVDLAAAQAFIQSHYDAFVKKNKERFGKDYEVYNAMQNVLGWDNIYDPSLHKVITPVSRIWNMNNSMNPLLGGYSMFCWDTYFASMMLATGNKELAYANAVEITKSITEEGFIPNFSNDNNYKSRDRSQPPVGSMAFWNIYQKYQEKWVLEYVYDKLLSWNRWWDKNRSVDGLLCWGSTPFEKVTYRYWETKGVNDTYGGALESGLDNSHMYDNIPFDTEKHVQKLNDVGLSSLYVMDCDLLAKIADELGKRSDAKELRKRGASYRTHLNKLWDDKQGFYYNRHTDTGTLNPRISPTNFYPLLANAPTQAQAERMIKEHLFNTDEFWGEWVIPSTPRNDPAFNDNNYWRGRIWAPLNFLVYMGLRNYEFPAARKTLSEKSKNLLLKGWLANGYVFENYNSVTGVGDDVSNSDKFYHWGALLGFITLMEDGYFKEENPVKNKAANN
ncbi:Endo-1 4-beta-xylanase A [termite gut metagenome]|uniref:Endo-1 4-beta-xylanase A n=1 Tax=termite gut metagenome TaxID=433724 RepID=A0A5J4S4C0_9ZZZZ